MDFRKVLISAVFALTAMVSLGQAQQTCCLTDLQDSIFSTYSDSGVGTVTLQPGATCDSFAVIWTVTSPGVTLVYTFGYKLVGTALRYTYIYKIGSAQPVGTSITIPGYCQIAVERLPGASGTAIIKASPNPFRSGVKIQFANPGRSASLQVFDARGRAIYSKSGIAGAEAEWRPRHAEPGIYLAKVTAGGKVTFRQIVCVK